jgi:hypothetical protein
MSLLLAEKYNKQFSVIVAKKTGSRGNYVPNLIQCDIDFIDLN